jgi:histidine triad (HIT) family protein
MLKKLIVALFIFSLGITAGAYLFKDTQPRSFLNIKNCEAEDCLSLNQLIGLVGSVGLQQFPDFVPFVVKETDKTVVIEPPVKKADIHYVIIPKKDIKDIADISEDDTEYIMDAYAVIRDLIKEEGIAEYKVYTNGPGYQTVNYLHFHLLSEKPE